MRIFHVLSLALFFTISAISFSSFATPTTNSRLQLAEANPMSAIACKAYKMFNSSIVRAICGIVIVLTGIGFGMGKISWGIVLGVIIGMVLFFGTGELLNTIVGNAGSGGLTVTNGVVTRNGNDVCACNYGLDGTCQSPDYK